MNSPYLGKSTSRIQMMRIHQWTKNLLVFVPLIAAFKFGDTDSIRLAVLSFLALSFLASATYICNDILDREKDRLHPRKKFRVIASGRVSPAAAGITAALLAVAAFMIGFIVGPELVIMMCGYLILTTAYSVLLKGYVLLDVILLASLYTWRVLLGSVVIGVATSEWLLLFSALFFLGLALVKRCTELETLAQGAGITLAGRDYRTSDEGVLRALGISSCVSALVVFCLFISSTETKLHYETPKALWLVAIALFYWSSRLWIKTARGEMHDDPVVYAIKDRASRLVLGTAAFIMVFAHFGLERLIRIIWQ